MHSAHRRLFANHQRPITDPTHPLLKISQRRRSLFGPTAQPFEYVCPQKGLYASLADDSARGIGSTTYVLHSNTKATSCRPELYAWCCFMFNPKYAVSCRYRTMLNSWRARGVTNDRVLSKTCFCRDLPTFSEAITLQVRTRTTKITRSQIRLSSTRSRGVGASN